MERQKIAVPADNYGRVYIGLLETDLTAKAKLCYGVMWSFGVSECWATIANIARRMSVSENTVRDAQKELAERGWIVAQANKEGDSKRWTMMPPAGTPLLYTDRPATPSTIEPPPFNHCTPPLQPLNPKQELKQEPKQERTLPDKKASGKRPDQDAFWAAANADWKAYLTGLNVPVVPMGSAAYPGFQNRLRQWLECFWQGRTAPALVHIFKCRMAPRKMYFGFFSRARQVRSEETTQRRSLPSSGRGR